MRVIDADALMDDAEMDGALYACLGGVDDVRFLVDSQPTIDAISVVHCQHCEHHSSNGCPDNRVWCRRLSRYMDTDGFCSYGERGEDNAE